MGFRENLLQGGLNAAGPLTDTLINAGLELFVNQPRRNQVAQDLRNQINPSIDTVRNTAQNVSGTLETLPQDRYDANIRTLNRQRGDFAEGGGTSQLVNRTLTSQLGYDPSQGPARGSMDARNAIGRYNLLGVDQANALKSNALNKGSALDEIVNDTGIQLGGQVSASRAQLTDELTQLDSTIGQTYGKDSPQYQQGVARAKERHSQVLGDMQKQLYVAKQNQKLQTRLAYDTLEQQQRATFSGLQAEMGKQLQAEQAMVTGSVATAFQYDEGMRQMFNQIERDADNQYYNDLASTRMDMFNLQLGAEQFAMQGNIEVANALLNTQYSPTAFTGWGAVSQSFTSGFQANKQADAMNQTQGPSASDWGFLGLTTANLFRPPTGGA